MTTSRSLLRDALGDYLSLRRALGSSSPTPAGCSGSSSAISKPTTWTPSPPSTRWPGRPCRRSVSALAGDPPVRGARVRRLPAQHRSLGRGHPGRPVPPGVCRATPYLYSDAEIGALIQAAAALQPRLRAATYQALISLLAVSGIRIGEAIGLDDEDFDAGRELLVVRHAKYGKHRLVRCTPAPCAPWCAMPGSGGKHTRVRPARHCSCPPPAPGCGTATSPDLRRASRAGRAHPALGIVPAQDS